MRKFCLLVAIFFFTGCDEVALFQPPLEPPEPVIRSGTDIKFVPEANGDLRITVIQNQIHELEEPPEIGLGRNGDWAKVDDTDLYTNVGGTWIWVR